MLFILNTIPGNLYNITIFEYKTINMTQDISPTIQMATKSIADQKQTNSIRKITIQSLSPIITKLEEHITFLLQQTSNLRNQNNNLLMATSNQHSLQKQLRDTQEEIGKIEKKMNLINNDKEAKLKEKQLKIIQIALHVQKLQKQSQTQAKLITQISKNNEDYLSRISANKQEQLSSIDQLKSNIEIYYEQQLSKIQSLKEEFEKLRENIESLQQKRRADQQQIKEISNITNLYTYERNDIKKIIQKTSYLENNVVMISDYQKDKKYQKISNQQTKNDVKAMIDEALTPQIRRFLPKLISKLDQLQRFQSILDSVCKKTEQNKEKQERRLFQIQQLYSNKFLTQQKNAEKSLLELIKKIDENYELLDDRIMMLEQRINSRLRPLQEEQIAQQQRWKSNLSGSISALEVKLKEYMEVWGQQFLDRQKDNIYQLVQTQKPPEEHQQQKKMQQLVFSMEPLLNQVKEDLKNAKDQVNKSKQTLLEKLSSFSNQIVKFKSDITRQTAENKRILQSYNLKLTQNKDTCNDLSLLIAKLTQVSALSYALSLDQQFLHRQHEIYVTYHDGILLQVTNSDTITYRRKEFIPEILKRAILAQIVKLIDYSIISKPLLGWSKPQNKPSHFFQPIQNNYQTLCEQNKLDTKANKANKAPNSDRKSLERKHIFKRQQISFSPKATSNSYEIFSKTINHDSGEQFHPTRYEVGFEQNRQYSSSRRKNIKLKKIDRKQ